MISQLFYGGHIHNYVYQGCVLKDIQSPRSLYRHRLTDRQRVPIGFRDRNLPYLGRPLFGFLSKTGASIRD